MQALIGLSRWLASIERLPPVPELAIGFKLSLSERAEFDTVRIA
jgi:hypothetical protein